VLHIAHRAIDVAVKPELHHDLGLGVPPTMLALADDVIE
jgi:hypothetical protein